MNDTRTVGQEIQDQVLAAARKGQQRVQSTMKTMTATAAMIRPQLPTLPRPKLSGLPRPTLNVPGLPTPAQIRERTPALTAMLPSPEQLRASAQEFAGQILAARRKVFDQVRSVTTPLAHQAAAALAQVGAPTAKAAEEKASAPADTTAAPQHSEDGEARHGAAHGKETTARNGARTPKPKAKAASK